MDKETFYEHIDSFNELNKKALEIAFKLQDRCYKQFAYGTIYAVEITKEKVLVKTTTDFFDKEELVVFDSYPTDFLFTAIEDLDDVIWKDIQRLNEEKMAAEKAAQRERDEAEFMRLGKILGKI